ncbi:MAG: sel1 repeat family protein [Zoogloeaceae bacterium]|jgi:TPR repeat protein|nr:sel1 repeat family protein [Zoogloeaceae bacterium]
MKNVFSALLIPAVMSMALFACARPSVGDLLRQGRAAYDASEYATAAKLFAKACENGSSEGCYALGRMYDMADGIPEDDAKAAQFYRKACDGGYFTGCNNLGAMHADGEGVEQDYAKAALLYAQACDGGDWAGCNNLGILHDEGNGVEKNEETARALHEKAFVYYEQSCAEEDSEDEDLNACYNRLGASYENGDEIKQDYSKAARLYEKSCNNKNGNGCDSLGELHAQGNGVEKNSKTAHALYEKAFTYRVQSCANEEDINRCYNLMGRLYENSDFVRRDYAKAAQLYEKSCDNENGEGCSGLGMLHEEGSIGKTDRKKAEALYEKAFLHHLKACDTKDSKICLETAEAYEEGDGSLRQDYAKAAALYEKVCAKENGSGCERLGNLYENGNVLQKNAEKAAELYAMAIRYHEKSCADGDGEGCFHLGALYDNGERMKQDSRKAFSYYKKGCTHKDGKSCAYAGLFHFEGKGGAEKDEKTAQEYFTTGCERENEDACEMLLTTSEEYREFIGRLNESAKELAQELKKELEDASKEPDS